MDWKKILNPPFIAAACVLLAGLIVWQATAWTMDWSLKKDAVPPRRPLYLIEDMLGTYHKIDEHSLSKAVVDELGTERYILRTYDDVAASGDAPSTVRLHAAYYTGMPGAVPYVRRRFYVIGGASGPDVERATVQLSGSRYYTDEHDRAIARDDEGHEIRLPALRVPVAIARVQPPRADEPAFVGYFYVANGRFTHARNEVQRWLSDPGTTRAYWCKIEMVPGRRGRTGFQSVNSAEEALAAVRRFLPKALPRLMATLPAPDTAGANPDR